jgi:hypothetical protein
LKSLARRERSVTSALLMPFTSLPVTELFLMSLPVSLLFLTSDPVNELFCMSLPVSDPFLTFFPVTLMAA